MAQAVNLPRLLSWYVLCKHRLEKQDTVILLACIQQIRLASYEHQYHDSLLKKYKEHNASLIRMIRNW